ncbi:MAG: 50S ribosomal protein L13 [Deltaproteobacteria bacterium]|nr:50S ribosomal protein L13 [Deltaproteobacteria bacterium]MBI3296363.1 50S ribosomal protein L13 [Deltaproteobacteria bacterium]
MAKDAESKPKTKKTAREAPDAVTRKAAAKVAAPSDKAEAAPKRKIVKANARRPLLGGTPLTPQGSVTGWRLVDASGLTLGRLSSCIATILMGKDKAGYTRFLDTGDHVVVINADKVALTGNKWNDKTYNYHTSYPGGIKYLSAREIRDSKFPERIVEWAVYGMLPKGHMGRRWYKKLYVYKGDQHPHIAQKPVPVTSDKLGALKRD